VTKKTKGFLFLLPLLLVIPLVLTWNSVFAPPIKRAQNYNVVLLTIDTTRADFIGAYGNRSVSTPNIDSLARDGVLFEHFYSTINTTLAAHASIFTGLYPRNHGVGRNSMRLNQKNLTIAEFLHANGYDTAAFIGSFALASVFGVKQGFETFDESFIGDMSDYVSRNASFANKDNKEFQIVLTKQKVGDIERRAGDVNKSFFGWLDQNKNKKFFAFVHYYDPHFPYNPPEEWYRRRLSAIPAGVPLSTPDRPAFEKLFENMTPALAKFQASNFNNFPLPNSMDALLKLYASEIEYADSAVGQIIKKLNETGLRNKTIFIVTADHGENLVDHPEFKTFFRHGFLTHDTETHIPFIVSCPGYLPSGERVNEVASEVDIFPTVADLLGFRPPRVDGISVLKEFFGQKIHTNRDIFAEASQPHLDFHKFAAQMVWVNDRNSAFARKGDYKYITAPWINYEAVFNLQEDPGERNNLLGSVSKGDLRKFRKDLKEWRSKAALGNIDSSFQLSDEERDKLKSLGYVQ
jgi:Arylsulfatase A and related enzymes